VEIKQYKTEETIFRQGDPSDCMYRIESGKVGIFTDYGGSSQAKIAELSAGQFLGEMGLLDKAPRSASAISLSDGARVPLLRLQWRTIQP
jgi:CRP-like cAMP-binding protein